MLEQTLIHERTERKNEHAALWAILFEERSKNEEERKVLMDTILMLRGVPPVHKKNTPKQPTHRETGFEGAMREAREAKTARQAEMARKAEEWKRANLNGTTQEPKLTQAEIWDANFSDKH